MDINLGKVTLQIRIYHQFEIGKQYIIHLCAHSQEGTSISLFLTNIYKKESGDIIAPTQRKFLSLPVIATIGGLLYIAKKKKWF